MIRVAAVVDLHWTPAAGGHVKCWERLAGAALSFPDALDLTVHYLGAEERTVEIGPNVRYRLHRPVFGTDRLGFLSRIPDHTDLAGHHPGLARLLAAAELIHTTSAHFSFARTVERIAALHGIPVVHSVHTDTPGYGRHFAGRILGRLGRSLRLDAAIEAAMRRRLGQHQARCVHVLVSREMDAERAARVLSPQRVSILRRGVDTALFDPAKRDRTWLEGRYGVPPERVVVSFAGRLDHAKGVMVLAGAVRSAIDGGAPLHLLCAGAGEDRDAILALLGDRASCPGVLAQAELARVLASADLFASPSRFESYSNVVQEAMASGLPVIVAEESGMARFLDPGRTGYALPGADVGAWATMLRGLAEDVARRAEMSRAARAHAEAMLPSWVDVLAEDLLPVWRRAVDERR